MVHENDDRIRRLPAAFPVQRVLGRAESAALDRDVR